MADSKGYRTTEDTVGDLVPVQSVVEVGNHDNFLIRRNSRACAATDESVSWRNLSTHIETHMLHVLGVICHFNSMESMSQQLERSQLGQEPKEGRFKMTNIMP